MNVLLLLYINIIINKYRDNIDQISPCRYDIDMTYHVRPHQLIIDQQGLGLRGVVHKEAHPVIPDLH